ncbi:MAG: hypothetical protein M3Q46_00130 [Verrucomicrobiota bacterium]|nr:hypothetical protein [Verrucomicrobiota bacterium]
MKNWEQLGEDIALLQYPLSAFGIDFGRNVTLLRLRDGRVIIHSTAPFTPEDVATIGRFGQPAWLVDVTLAHDTFAPAARRAFPALPYLAPEGFTKTSGIETGLLFPPPPAWDGEIDVIALDGLWLVREHAFFHRPSRTLVLGDALFQFPPETGGWPRFFVQRIMGLPRLVGLSRFFRFMIRDRALFARSLQNLLALDFEQIVMAHRMPILRDAKSVLGRALRDSGLTASD